MSNLGFKGDILHRYIPSGYRTIHPPDSLRGGYNITGHRHLHVHSDPLRYV